LKSLLLYLILLSSVSSGQKACIYPLTERSDNVDTIWHKAVEDPYRWLEDIHSEKTIAWLSEQALLRDKYGSKLADNISEHLINYSRIKSKRISKHGKYYFTFRLSTATETASLYYQLLPDDEAKLLFNPNTLSRTDIISIDGISISDDNKTLAIIFAKNGSDWKTIRFLDIESRELLNDSVNFVKYSPVYWSGNGVFYIQYDVKDVSESFSGLIKIKALQYHVLGTSQTVDIPVFIPENYMDDFSFEVTPAKKYLILTCKKIRDDKTSTTISYKSLPFNVNEPFNIFISSEKKTLNFNVIGELNDKLLIASNMNARNGMLYKCDPTRLNALDKFIPQYKERLLSASIINENKIVVLYNGDKRSYAVINDSSGNKLKSWTIPEGFSFSGMTYTRGDSVMLYYFDSFFNPSSVYKINLNTLEQISLSKTIVPFSFNELTTEVVYYYSKDSTIIPMYLTHKKSMKIDGDNPTILYGYGGFGISTHPFFDVNNIAFLNSGGLLAVPQLRGGGDFPGWHAAGKRLKKQNTFDDFISAAEFLIRDKYTNPGKIAVLGGSNGGLLVGACMTQRPDLFKVVVSQAGVLDMIRYHRFNVGYRYIEEYGNIDDSLDFSNLLRYSPVHNVKKNIDYPATLLVASDNDDRVSPFHSFKFLSQLQFNGSGKNPYILYYEQDAGHHGSRVLDERMKTKAFVYSFIYKYLGMENKIYFED
jgi:prolyl oligopeptidase